MNEKDRDDTDHNNGDQVGEHSGKQSTRQDETRLSDHEREPPKHQSIKKDSAEVGRNQSAIEKKDKKDTHISPCIALCLSLVAPSLHILLTTFTRPIIVLHVWTCTRCPLISSASQNVYTYWTRPSVTSSSAISLVRAFRGCSIDGDVGNGRPENRVSPHRLREREEPSSLYNTQTRARSRDEYCGLAERSHNEDSPR